jgi:hypothetical protein
MRNRVWHVFQRFLLLHIVAELFKPVKSETSSFCATCTVTCSNLYSAGSSALTHLIDHSYKSYVVADAVIGPPVAGYANYSQWFRIDQGVAMTVVTVFIVNFTPIPGKC